MKAGKTGPVIGYATKNQKQGEDFVEILLQPAKYYIPEKGDKQARRPVVITSDGNIDK